MPTKFCTTVTVLPPRPAFTRTISTRPLDLRGGSFRFASSELPGGRPALFKSANGLLKSLILDLCPIAIQCPCLHPEKRDCNSRHPRRRAPKVTVTRQADRLYAYYNESTAFNLLQLAVTPTNLQVTASQRSLISGFGARIHYLGGRLYASTGRVVDPERSTLLGEIPGGHQDALILPLADAR